MSPLIDQRCRRPFFFAVALQQQHTEMTFAATTSSKQAQQNTWRAQHDASLNHSAKVSYESENNNTRKRRLHPSGRARAEPRDAAFFVDKHEHSHHRRNALYWTSRRAAACRTRT